MDSSGNSATNKRTWVYHCGRRMPAAPLETSPAAPEGLDAAGLIRREGLGYMTTGPEPTLGQDT